MFVKHAGTKYTSHNTIYCMWGPEHQTKFQGMKNLIKGQSGPKGSCTLLYTCMHIEEFTS